MIAFIIPAALAVAYPVGAALVYPFYKAFGGRSGFAAYMKGL